MRLLVVSTMFPSEELPASGIFIGNFLRELNPHLDDLLVVSARAYVPRILTWRKRWARYRNLSRDGLWQGVEVVRPGFIALPVGGYLTIAGPLMERCILSKVKGVLETRRFDAILGIGASSAGDVAVRLSRRFNIPSIVWCIGTDLNDVPRRAKASTRRTLEKASFVVTSSADLARRARSICPTLERVKPFYRGVDLETFRGLPPADESRRALGIPEDSLVLIHVGRLMHQKGIRELLAAFRKFSSHRPSVYLILIGEDLMGAELDKLVSDSGASERVIRPGLVSHQEVARHLSVSDVLVLGSYHEGLPNAVVEAMAAGVAVVASQVGGIPEIVIDGETGLLVPPKDPASLFLALSRMKEDETLRQRCIKRARSLAFTRFDVTKNARSFLPLLNEVVAGSTINSASHCLAVR